MNMIIAHNIFKRSDEHRELILYREGQHFTLWEVTGDPKNSENGRRKKIASSVSETEANALFKKESERLCAEKFAILEPQS